MSPEVATVLQINMDGISKLKRGNLKALKEGRDLMERKFENGSSLGHCGHPTCRSYL